MDDGRDWICCCHRKLHVERNLILEVRTFAKISGVLEGDGEQNCAHVVVGLCVEAARGAVLLGTDVDHTQASSDSNKRHDQYYIID
jgi:hypothetical protein